MKSRSKKLMGRKNPGTPLAYPVILPNAFRKQSRISSCSSRRRKGAVQMDFIIAIGLFIIVFGVVIQMLTNYFKTAESTAEIETLTSRALSLLSIADFGFTPESWTGSGNIDRIGLGTKAYRFAIAVNNSQPFYINQSDSVTDLTDELITFSYDDMAYADVNSTSVYEGSSELPYQISGRNITFKTNIDANTVKYFTVYFDDDSNFTSKSTAVSGSNKIRETRHAPLPIQVLQYRKIQILNSSNYDSVKNSIKSDDFRITIQDIQVNPVSTFLDYGGEVPRSGNVVSVQRYFIFQNSTAGIRQGKIVVRTW